MTEYTRAIEVNSNSTQKWNSFGVIQLPCRIRGIESNWNIIISLQPSYHIALFPWKRNWYHIPIDLAYKNRLRELYGVDSKSELLFVAFYLFSNMKGCRLTLGVSVKRYDIRWCKFDDKKGKKVKDEQNVDGVKLTRNGFEKLNKMLVSSFLLSFFLFLFCVQTYWKVRRCVGVLIDLHLTK